MANPTSSSPTPNQAPRDRRNDPPHDPDKPVIEGIINPSPKAFDPSNPAGAPRIERVHDDEAQADAHAELTELLRKDTSRLAPAEKQAHDKRVHELHYHTNGEDVPVRGRKSVIVPPTGTPAA